MSPLKDLGIEKQESSRWQKLANIPEDKYEDYVFNVKERTQSGLLKIANEFRKENEPQPNNQEIETCEAGEFPKGAYKIVLADPPWSYNDALDLQNEGALNHYETMKLEEIKKLPVDSITDKDSVLFLWVTMPMLAEGLEVIKAWGFTYKTCGFCWIKTNPKSNTVFKGIGRWVMGNAELCLLATKGKPH